MNRNLKNVQRDIYFDNLKFELIALVVMGHFLLPLEKTRLIHNLFFLIYAFHMPCFVMVSGYFSKGVFRDGRFRTDKLFQLLWLYLIFKVLTHFTEGLVEGSMSFSIDFFTESGAPWYLLSLSLWYLTIPVICRFKARGVIAVTLVFSLLAGYQDSVGYFLSMNRTIAFAPFFYFGYFMSGDGAHRFLESRYRWGCLAAAALVAGILFLGAYDYLGGYTSVVYGLNYRSFHENLYVWGPLIRAAWYGIALLLCGGLMAATPRNAVFYSGIGKRTLQIYILHRLLRDLAQYFGLYEWINIHSKLQVLLLLAMSAVLTLALGNQKFGVLFDKIRLLPLFCRPAAGEKALR